MLAAKQSSSGTTGATSCSSKLTYAEMIKVTGKNRFQLLDGRHELTKR